MNHFRTIVCSLSSKHLVSFQRLFEDKRGEMILQYFTQSKYQ